ncbi:MAG: maleylpyruvate isomerase family mycothiol-dependent enzyme [Actinomycetota bacterium]
MDHTTRLERARQDGERIVELCEAHAAAQVPSCPDWDGAGLLSHMTRVWHMLAMIVEDRREGFPGKDDFPARPEPGEEAAAAGAALDRVITAMAAVEPGTPMWSWGTTQSSDYFHRRLHLENLVHRVDAEQMAGLSPVIDSDEATDAVAERFEEFVHRRPERPAGSLHIHRTDGEGEWTVKIVDGSIVVTEEHAKGDAAARGSGPDLMLAMWGRGSIDALEVFGAAPLVEEWFALCR